MILEKYRPNAYKIDLPKDIDFSPIFNVKELVPYKGPNFGDIEYHEGWNKAVADIKVPKMKQPQFEKILDSRVMKSTRNKIYKEHFVKWMDKGWATWISKGYF